MELKFWGCRGSIPVPDGRMIQYGGNTTSVEVNINGRILIIDAGTGIRKLGEDLMRRGIRNIDMVITHSHWDHIQGFPFFAPVYSDNVSINIFGHKDSYRQIENILDKQMSMEYFPVSFSDLKAKIDFIKADRNTYDIDGCRIKIIRANHPIFTIGLRFDSPTSSFVFITDNELKQEIPATHWEEFVDFCRGADYLIHDSQFTDKEYDKRRGWGHSTYEQSIALAAESGVGKLGFFHHDPNRMDSEIKKLEKRYRSLVKKSGYGFSVFAVKEQQSLKI